MKGDEEEEREAKQQQQQERKGQQADPEKKGTGTIDWDRSCESLYLLLLLRVVLTTYYKQLLAVT